MLFSNQPLIHNNPGKNKIQKKNCGDFCNQRLTIVVTVLMSLHVQAVEHNLLSTSTLITFSFFHGHRQISSPVICWENSLCVCSAQRLFPVAVYSVFKTFYPGIDNNMRAFQSQYVAKKEYLTQ